MPEINPVTKDQLFEKKIAENTGSNYNVGDISDVVPVTKDQALLKEIALNSAGQSGDITELEGKVADNTGAIEAIVNEYGAKNLLPLSLDTIKNLNTDGTWSGNVYTMGDGTITVNTDNKGSVISILANGTFTGAYLYLINENNTVFESGKYIINGVVEGSSSTYCIRYISPDWVDHDAVYDGDQLMNINVSRIRIDILTGTYNNVTFYPMIRDARITDPTYVPYAMTNKELTEKAYQYMDFSYTKLGSNTLVGLTASAIIGARVINPSSLPNASHIPVFYIYGGNPSNWNIRWLNRDTGEMITTPVDVSFTLRVYYIP